MNGLELSDRIREVATDIERFSKVALAATLARYVLISHELYVDGLPDQEAVEAEVAKLRKELKEASDIARRVYACRRADRLITQLENPDPKPKRKRRRKKRGTKRGL